MRIATRMRLQLMLCAAIATRIATLEAATPAQGLYTGDCRVLAPSNEAFPCHVAAFGGYLPLNPTELPLVVARENDGAVGAMTACSSSSTQSHREYDGAIVLVRRGDCAFQQKLATVAAGGGAGMILINSDDSVLQLGSLEFEPLQAVAVSIKRTDGDRLVALVAMKQSTSTQDVVTVTISSPLGPLDQAWRRIQHLLSINAPLVAYETFIEALPSHAKDIDASLDAILRHGSEENSQQDDHDDQLELFTFCQRCMDVFPDNWELGRDAAFHAAVTAAATLTATTPPPMGADVHRVLHSAAMKLVGGGYYAHAISLLTGAHDIMATRCLVAFIQFLQGDLLAAIRERQCGHGMDLFNVSGTGLNVPYDNYVRLMAFEMSDSDTRCLQRAVASVDDSTRSSSSIEVCCQRRVANDGDHDSHQAAALLVRRRAYSYRSAFIEELFHTLNIMGVFMDEIGAFQESLGFFRQASRLCEDWSLSLEFREALAIPIAFDSTTEMLSHLQQLEAKISTLRETRQQQERVLSSLTGTHHSVDFFARPEEASYFKYSMTPPTMFVGYQGQDVLNLQQAIFSLRNELFPSLRSSSSSLRHPLERRPPLGMVMPPSPPPSGSRRRRIAFVSSWFRNHSVGKLMLGVIQRLDRTKFHVLVYRAVHFLPYADEWTKKFKDHADSYMELPANQEAALELLRHEAIDVLVYPELGMDAWLVFLAHHRVAPVQCVFWGHPITTGNPSIDYFISSEYFLSDLFEGSKEKEEEVEQKEWPGPYHGSSFSEQVVLFRGLSTFFTNHFDPMAQQPFNRAMLHLPATARLYVCPQTLMKLHPNFDLVLHGILLQDPKARIILVSSPTQRVWKEQLRRRFRKTFGEHHRRILFFATLPYQDFMGLLSTADVILDPFPFGGGVTTLDALAVGTSVVTLPSAQGVMQLAAGFLRYIDVTETIASTVDDYVTAALRVAQDLEYRKTLHDRILARHQTLYEDEQTLDDWNTFLDSVGIE